MKIFSTAIFQWPQVLYLLHFHAYYICVKESNRNKIDCLKQVGELTAGELTGVLIVTQPTAFLKGEKWNNKGEGNLIHGTRMESSVKLGISVKPCAAKG